MTTGLFFMFIISIFLSKLGAGTSCQVGTKLEALILLGLQTSRQVGAKFQACKRRPTQGAAGRLSVCHLTILALLDFVDFGFGIITILLAAVHFVRFMLDQIQQPVFISTGAFGASECADRVNGVPVLAGHFHHRGSLRHCSS